MDIIKIFTHNDTNYEINIKGDTNKLLFRASHIGNILQLTNINAATKTFDETEKKYIQTQTSGGIQQVSFLTEDGLYALLFKSSNPIAKIVKKWISEIIKELRLSDTNNLEQQLQNVREQLENITNQKQETEQQLNEVIQVNKELIEESNEIKEKIPMIYIYNIDTRKENPELKIGYTTNIYNRTRSYKQTCKFGKIEYSVEIQNANIKTVENYIHNALARFLLKDEVFCLSVEEAKLIIMRIVNTINIIQINNDSERQLKLSKICEQEIMIINNTPNPKISTCTIGTQTDFYENSIEIQPTLLNHNEHTAKFDQFIKNHCIIRNDVEVSSTDIIGQYRIVNQIASKEIYNAFKTYLDTRFKQSRLKTQSKNQVVNGYIGIKLNDIEYTKNIEISDPQSFIFNECVFSPSGKVLASELVSEYIKWKTNTSKEILPNDEDKLKKYLKQTNYVVYTTIWANNSNGQGYYGIQLKRDIDRHRTTSSTGKTVEKRELSTNQLLGMWETISKAAESEKMCSAKMSRSIKSKTIFNDDYFYCISA
jgi:prophage antirepressor-like protein